MSRRPRRVRLWIYAPQSLIDAVHQAARREIRPTPELLRIWIEKAAVTENWEGALWEESEGEAWGKMSAHLLPSVAEDVRSAADGADRSVSEFLRLLIARRVQE